VICEWKKEKIELSNGRWKRGKRVDCDLKKDGQSLPHEKVKLALRLDKGSVVDVCVSSR
jgi:hypothetical protein